MITHHSLLKVNQTFARILKKVLTEMRKDKNTQENMNEIKEHEISNTLHRGLSVAPKTDGGICFNKYR